jgi:hypothetical protein
MSVTGFRCVRISSPADGRVDLQIRLANVDTMFFHGSDDARFQVAMPPDTQALQPKQLRQMIYGKN